MALMVPQWRWSSYLNGDGAPVRVLHLRLSTDCSQPRWGLEEQVAGGLVFVLVLPQGSPRSGDKAPPFGCPEAWQFGRHPEGGRGSHPCQRSIYDRPSRGVKSAQHA